MMQTILTDFYWGKRVTGVGLPKGKLPRERAYESIEKLVKDAVLGVGGKRSTRSARGEAAMINTTVEESDRT